MSKKYFVVLVSLFLVFSFIGFGCKKQTNQSASLRFRLSAEPTSLDPAQAGDLDSIQVVGQIFDGLVEYDPKTLKVLPAVAEKWEMNKTATEFTFYLKKGVKFQNGREVNAKDFKYAWDRVVDPKTASQLTYHFSSIEGFDEVQNKKAKSLSGVTTPNDYTLKVKLSRSLAEFVTTLGHTAFSPVPKEELERNEKAFSEKPVGNGPFKILKWAKGKEIKTEIFDDYYGQKPKIKEVNYKPIDDNATALKEFRAGNLDYTYIPPGQLKQLKQEKQFKVKVIPSLSTYYYVFDVTKKPWNDKKVRQAVNYAVNKKEIIEKFSENGNYMATGLIPKGMPGYSGDISGYDYSPEKAKELLAEAGYEEGKNFPEETLFFEEGYGHDIVAQIIQEDLKDVGIKIKIQGLESGAFYDEMDNKKMSFYRIAWTADYPNMDSFLSPLFATGSDMNLSQYSNKVFDSKLDKAGAMVDYENRLELYRQAEKILMEDAPFLPLQFETTRIIVNPKINDMVFSSLGYVDMKKVWIEK